ncbi:MAG: Flp pilus assembly protein CpaB [Actinomycetes bacterium]
MIRRRIVAALMAVLLAVGGGALLLAYVSRADERAMAGLQTAQVLVVTRATEEGTPADEATGLVTSKTLPAVAVAPGSVVSLSELTGRVASTDLQPGEQVLASRFVDPAALRAAGEVEVPTGLSQVSLLLDPQRILGGHLTAGSTVGVFVSLAKDGDKPAQTHLTLDKVLVTRVQGGLAPPTTNDDQQAGDSASAAPEGGVMITLAVSAADAEKVIFGAEHGTVWLAHQPAEAVAVGTRVVTEANLYR